MKVHEERGVLKGAELHCDAKLPVPANAELNYDGLIVVMPGDQVFKAPRAT
jgi:hypothetical protein